MKKFLHALPFLLLFLPALASAQSWPSRPVRIIVPVLAGGSVDQTARFFATELSKALGQPFVVENKPGANGVIGLRNLAQAQPDGYTLGISANSFQTISPFLSPTPLPYDTVKDFTPISGLVNVAHVILARPTLPASTIPELVALAKATPDGLNHGAASNTGASYLASVLFRRRAGVKFTDVFYKGAAGAYTDLMGGQIDILFDSLGAAIPLIKSGRVKAIATTQEKRHPLTPDIPTVAETYPGFDTSGWYALYGPAGLPGNIVNRLNTAVARIFDSPQFHIFAENYGYEAMTGKPGQLAATQASELAQWKEIAKVLTAKPG